jgi:hypothetical protein
MQSLLRSCVASTALAVSLNACSGDETARRTAPDASMGTDGPQSVGGANAGGSAAVGGQPSAGGVPGSGGVADSATDGRAGDASSDAPADATRDTSVDAPPDSPGDVSIDAVRDAAVPDVTTSDGPLYCPAPKVDAGPLGPGVLQYCTGWSACNGYENFVAGYWDPCQPWGCGFGGATYCHNLGSTSAYAAPDGTPCDDNDPQSFAGTPCTSDADCDNGGIPVCAGGDRDGLLCTTDDDCTPNRAGPCRPTCDGGSNAGNICNLDADCPSATCSISVKKCNAGDNIGNVCTTNSDCNSVLVDYYAQGISGCNKFCKGGTSPTNPVTHCFINTECSAQYGAAAVCCPGGGLACNVGGQQRRCNGGLLDGQSCLLPSDCVAARCVKWSCDLTPGRNYCVGQDGIPSCPNGQTDCDLTPYNKYCSLDPDYLRNDWVSGTLADPAAGPTVSLARIRAAPESSRWGRPSPTRATRRRINACRAPCLAWEARRALARPATTSVARGAARVT